MILVGSQRSGAGNLARHLLNSNENDHVTVHELRGFAADNLRDAFEEAHAVSLGTRCKQFLFSLSFNPPKDAEARMDDLYQAMERAEDSLELTGQPRALVVHEKNGRRHLHAVWSRIDANTMTAINMSFYKSRLNDLSRELFLDHGWELPEGYKSRHWKNPMNFTLTEWQQAKRVGHDPREIKIMFREAWERSDNFKSFKSAIEEHGYYLAKGNQRGHVAVDFNGKIYSVARYASVKTKDVKERLGLPDKLPSVEEIVAQNQKQMTGRIKSLLDDSKEKQVQEVTPRLKEHRNLVLAQRQDRKTLKTTQELRRDKENAERQSRFRRGLPGIFDILTGKAMKQRRQNERETKACDERDHQERETTYRRQMQARATLQIEIDELRRRQELERIEFTKRLAGLLEIKTDNERGRRDELRLRLSM